MLHLMPSFGSLPSIGVAIGICLPATVSICFCLILHLHYDNIGVCTHGLHWCVAWPTLGVTIYLIAVFCGNLDSAVFIFGGILGFARIEGFVGEIGENIFKQYLWSLSEILNLDMEI